MKNGIRALLSAAILSLVVPVTSAVAQGEVQSAAANQIKALEVAEQGGSLYVRVEMKEALSAPPASFSVANPARIAFDFPGTANALGRSVQEIGQGELRSANIVQAGDRTRLVLNLVKMTPYQARVDGRNVIIQLNPISESAVSMTSSAQSFANFSDSRASVGDGNSIRDVNFRRGKDGEGRVIVQLSHPDTGIDIRQQGGKLIVDLLKTSLPEHLRRRADVTDFATPVTSVESQQQGDKVRLVITPTGQWEHNAYQSDNQFVIEVKRVVDDPTKLVQRGQYQGEKLSLNFQNIDVRSVLQVIADFTNFNIITSDTVQGNLTLRLKDVPWDQALDIILQAKGLDMRKNGNVIWIAPGEELATREKLQLEAKAQIGDLEPLQTESFQVNYHKAKEIFDFLKNKDQSILSKRGSVVVDERSNKLFVTDVAARLGSLRRLINEIDVAPRQVLIEARIVEASKEFARDLGVRLGYGDAKDKSLGGGAKLGFGSSEFVSSTTTAGTVDFQRNVGESATSGSGFLPTGFGSLNLTLFNSSLTRFLNLELAALESDGRGRVVSSPRVLTANQVEASIEQGTEVPYLQASSSGATNVAFKKAVLSLKVKPQITPDGRLQLSIEVNKDRPLFESAVLNVPPIETKNVKSEVLIDNGGTVVIGGIYEEEETSNEDRVPILGELPVVGFLFRTRSKISNRKELLVFITPKIVSDSLTLR
ncbi:type IV pilus secretin PilQ [Azoarcus olearius]|uniref:Type IV pilus biogenesis and competence protein PilQ n=1 Tax=Azoarcus sp. (strain BH72) TaxID=418699 RepID=A1KBQ6_AZOSB|nr:type IV pilus secretin PilQ [Azoarcus olearius]CAL96262.1 probable type 4 fimbrial biogenesis protein [Azoarcus olearius]